MQKKMIKLVTFFIFIVCFMTSCSKNKTTHEAENIPVNSILIEKKNAKEFIETGRLQKLIKLDTSINSLIGRVEKVIIDKNGDIFVLDRFIGKKVFRFNKDGKFLNCYGSIGMGPGQYPDIFNFHLDSSGNIILLSSLKLLKFEKNGNFLNEKRINFSGIDINSLFSKLYIFVLKYRYSPKIKNAIIIMDLDFNAIGGLSEYDLNLEKYIFTSTSKIAADSRNIYFIDNYDLRINIFNPVKNNTIKLYLPNDNKQLNDIWRKSTFTENDRNEISKKIHRFDSIYAFNDTLFLTERCIDKKILNYWLLNLNKRKAIIFNFPWDDFVSGKLLFFNIIGSYSDGLIGVISDVEKFNEFKKAWGNNYKILNEIEFNMDDNPILVFLKFEKIWD